jgi:hypothetical protein
MPPASRRALALWLGGGLGLLLVAWVLSRPEGRAADVLLAGLGLGAVIVGVWWVSGRLGFVAEHPVTLEESFLGTNSRRMESLSFVAPVAYTVDWLILFSDASKVLTLGIVARWAWCWARHWWRWPSGSFRWEGFAGTEDTANHIVGAVLMGVGGVTAMGCTDRPGPQRRQHAGAGQLPGAGRHPGRRRARCPLPGLARGAQPVTHRPRWPPCRPTWSAASARCAGCTATPAMRGCAPRAWPWWASAASAPGRPRRWRAAAWPRWC